MSLPTLQEIREQFLEEYTRLDSRYKVLSAPETYPVELSPRLQQLNEEVARQAADAGGVHLQTWQDQKADQSNQHR